MARGSNHDGARRKRRGLLTGNASPSNGTVWYHYPEFSAIKQNVRLQFVCRQQEDEISPRLIDAPKVAKTMSMSSTNGGILG